MKILYLYDNYPAYRNFFTKLKSKLNEKGHSFVFYYGYRKENASRQETEYPFDIKKFEKKVKKIGCRINSI